MTGGGEGVIMSSYQPGLDHRATCPHCGRRVNVYRPKGGGGRVCRYHRSTERARVFMNEPKRCHGSGEVCVEDRKAGEG